MCIENVYHPDHYNQGNIECIDAIREWLGKDRFIGFCEGNAIKYICREQHKGGLEDLMKAEYYIDMVIEIMSPNNDEK